jgi:hypothetical protein
MTTRNDRQRTEKPFATEEPPRAEEPRQVIEEYIADLREVLRKPRRLFN